MKVYVLSHSEPWEGITDIRGVFTTREAAEKFAPQEDASGGRHWYLCCGVDEMELDAVPTDADPVVVEGAAS